MSSTSRAALVAALLLAPAPAWATLDPELAAQVRSAVDVGLRSLRFTQQADGSWPGGYRVSALATRALVESHRRYREEDGPFMRRALAFLAAGAGEHAAAGEPSLAETAAALPALSAASTPAYRAAAERRAADLERRLAAPGGASCEALGLARHALPAAAPAASCRPAGPEEGLLSRLLAGDVEAVGEALDSASGGGLSARDAYFLLDALPASGADGPSRRAALARALIEAQRLDGRWGQGGPDAATVAEETVYALLALERLYAER